MWELQEAADPVRKLSEQLILGELVNMPRTPAYADMRIGVAKRASTVYVAPEWRRGTGAGTSRADPGCLDAQAHGAGARGEGKQVEHDLGKFLDTLADDWGRGA